MLWLVIVLAALVVATLPVWSYSREWGYNMAGIVGVVFASALLFYVANLGTT